MNFFCTSDYFPLDIIGSGSYGNIWSAIHVPSKRKVAIKTIFRENFQDETAIRSILNEHKVLSKIKHPFIVRPFELIQTTNSFRFVMELIEGKDILDVMNKKRGFSKTQAKHIFAQLVSILEFLHEKGIVHCDLKPENLILDRSGDIHLLDFGFASDNGFYFMKTQCGTIMYMAPEMFQGHYGMECEFWFLGVILYAMLYSNLPFVHVNIEIAAEMIQKQEPSYENSVSPSAISLLQSLLNKNPILRPTFKEIKNHQWMSEVDWVKLNGLGLLSVPANDPIINQSLAALPNPDGITNEQKKSDC